MKILICTVGGSPDPVVHAIQTNRADFVIFLCSTGGGAAASDLTIEQETEFRQKLECPECGKQSVRVVRSEPIAKRAGLSSDQYSIVRIKDPDRLEDVVAACHEAISVIRQRCPVGRVHVVANYTGGTKTMSFGLGLVGIQMMWFPQKDMEWELQLNTTLHGRPNLVSVGGGDVVVRQGASLVLCDLVLAQVKHLEAGHQYDAAVHLLEDLVQRLELGTTCRYELATALNRVRMWAAWDRFDYEAALHVAKSDPTLQKTYEKQLKRLIRIRELLCSDEPWPPKGLDGRELVQDVLDNAKRRLEQKRFDDAVARYYRATEMLAQVRLRSGYGVRTGDVKPGLVPEGPVREWLESQRLPPRHAGEVRPIQLALYNSYELLVKLDDPLGKYFDANREDLLVVIEARNESLFAHGLSPITEEIWSRLGPKWERWLQGAMKTFPPK